MTLTSLHAGGWFRGVNLPALAALCSQVTAGRHYRQCVSWEGPVGPLEDMGPVDGHGTHLDFRLDESHLAEAAALLRGLLHCTVRGPRSARNCMCSTSRTEPDQSRSGTADAARTGVRPSGCPSRCEYERVLGVWLKGRRDGGCWRCASGAARMVQRSTPREVGLVDFSRRVEAASTFQGFFWGNLRAVRQEGSSPRTGRCRRGRRIRRGGDPDAPRCGRRSLARCCMDSGGFLAGAENAGSGRTRDLAQVVGREEVPDSVRAGAGGPAACPWLVLGALLLAAAFGPLAARTRPGITRVRARRRR